MAKRDISPFRLDMLARLMDSSRSKQLAWTLDSLMFYPRCDEMYMWLIANRLTGTELLQFFAQHDCSHLRIAQELLSRLDKWHKNEIIMGRDIL